MGSIFCKDTGETVNSYTEYLKTRHWIKLKDKFHKTQIKECVMCGTDKNLNIHHMTYERIGNENFSDLVYLCKDCHSKLHEALGDSKTKYLAALVRHKKKHTKSKNKPKSKTKSKTKQRFICDYCIDGHKRNCLSGYKSIDNRCKHFKAIKIKGRIINDEYTSRK